MAKTKLAFIADLHYYSPQLGTTGRAYELRQGGDQNALPKAAPSSTRPSNACSRSRTWTPLCSRAT